METQFNQAQVRSELNDTHKELNDTRKVLEDTRKDMAAMEGQFNTALREAQQRHETELEAPRQIIAALLAEIGPLLEKSIYFCGVASLLNLSKFSYIYIWFPFEISFVCPNCGRLEN